MAKRPRATTVAHCAALEFIEVSTRGFVGQLRRKKSARDRIRHRHLWSTPQKKRKTRLPAVPPLPMTALRPRHLSRGRTYGRRSRSRRKSWICRSWILSQAQHARARALSAARKAPSKTSVFMRKIVRLFSMCRATSPHWSRVPQPARRLVPRLSQPRP